MAYSRLITKATINVAGLEATYDVSTHMAREIMDLCSAEFLQGSLATPAVVTISVNNRAIPYHTSAHLALSIKDRCDIQFARNAAIAEGYSRAPLNPFPAVYPAQEQRFEPHPYLSAFSTFVGPNDGSSFSGDDVVPTAPSQAYQCVADDVSQQPVWQQVPVVYMYEENSAIDDWQQSPASECVDSPVEEQLEGDVSLSPIDDEQQLEGESSFIYEESLDGFICGDEQLEVGFVEDQERTQDSISSYEAGAQKTVVGNWSLFSFHPAEDDAGFEQVNQASPS